MLFLILLILAVAVILTFSIEKIIARLGVQREEPTKDGLAVLAERLEQWSSARKRK